MLTMQTAFYNISQNVEAVEASTPVWTLMSSIPEIAVSGSNVYLAWRQDLAASDYMCCKNDLFFRASNDNGSTFSDAIDLGTSLNSPRIATLGNNVYVVSVGHGPESRDIFFRSSHDNGSTFSDTVNLSDTPKWSSEPEIAVVDNNVYVVWYDGSSDEGTIFFRRSTDGGTTFEPIANLSEIPGEASFPKIAASGNNVYVVWAEWTAPYGTEPRSLEVFFRTSNDNGNTFGPLINLSTNDGKSAGQEIAVSGSNVYVVWKDTNSNVFFRASNDNGNTFENTVNLSNNQVRMIDVHMAASESNVYVMWDSEITDEILNPDGWHNIFFKASHDNGKTFGDTVNLSKNKGWSGWSKIAVSGSDVYAMWGGGGDPDIYPPGIYLRVSNDNGNTFVGAINLSLFDTEGSYSVLQIAPTEDIAYLVQSVYYCTYWGQCINTVPSEFYTEPLSLTVIDVNVDIKPGSSSNTVNCDNLKGKIAVGIYTDDEFDAQTIDLSATDLEGITASKIILKDLDGDGDLDAILKFKKAYLCEFTESLSVQSISLQLHGATTNGLQFEGTDSINLK
ncbi:MAG: hypothetical protein HMLIMOIP_001053 [Candidatus Nitrosomirales archaeon]|jgi:hypothetical protein